MNFNGSLAPRNEKKWRFSIISTCPEPWGGSEELWSRAAAALVHKGHTVTAFKTKVVSDHPAIQRLEALPCPVRDLYRARVPVPVRLTNLVAPSRYQLIPARRQTLHVALHLKARHPDLVIISQGDNFDALQFANLCRRFKMPYVLLAQKATQTSWPHDFMRRVMRDCYQSAQRCYFVSQHNQRLTEDQIGCDLINAEVVRNPFLVPMEGPLPWPQIENETWHLACVARLFILDKGQDLLLQVLALPKWKARNLHVNFYGQGLNRQGLIGYAARHGVGNISFHGQVCDVPGIWRENHALILPSRNEGLPLALVEAMLCGRPAIVTDVGGNSEVLEDERTGFLATSASVEAIDDALERAWQKRHRWQEMGVAAEQRIREMVPPDPAGVFADKLLELMSTPAPAKPVTTEYSSAIR
jgi:glycosyltransferase involved in cell wall biosynthesis